MTHAIRVYGRGLAQLYQTMRQTRCPSVGQAIANCVTFGRILVTTERTGANLYVSLEDKVTALSVDTPPSFPPLRTAYATEPVRITFPTDDWNTVLTITREADLATPKEFLRSARRNYVFAAETLARGGQIILVNPNLSRATIRIDNLFGY